MAYRSKSYTYSGGDVIFPIPFDYIKENDIYVFINGKSTTDFIIENHQVKLTVIPSELPATILIKSQTDITSAVTKWQDTSLLDDLNLTLSNNQLLYSTQELYDAFDDFSTEITQDVTQQITDLENKTNQQISEFKEEVNETIQEVSDAAEKINELETAVEDAKNAAITAESKATDAALQASNATTQAQLAQQAAQEAEAAVNEIESLSIADKDLSNITEAGKEVIKKAAGSGFSLFDVVEKDHILSFEESMGFGLLGTYVYKEPVAGSRYGYPDFYNECVAQKSTEGNTLLALKNNVEIVGSPVVNNGVLSGFSSTTWANLPKAFNPSNKNWEMFYKFKTGTIGTIQYILNTISAGYQPFDIRIGEDGKLQVASFINNTSTPLFSIIGTTALTPATDYYVKLAYNSVTGYELSLGTSKDNLLIEGTNNTTTAINSGSIPTLGADFNNDGNYFQGAFTGSIDLKECYIKIDNELWWSGATTATKNPNGHIFYDIADKATVDEIFAQRGEAWFYGVDTENERVFLPRGTRSQYTVNTDETGDYVEAGLPNITGTMTADISEGVATGALKIDTIYSGAMWQGSVNVARMRNWSLDASLSNPVYGKSDTVQPYATKKLLYIVVGNVQVQSAASDVVDVTTTENDTVPLFTGQYFDFKPNNVSWLKANETKASGGIYTSCYNKLVQALTPDNNIWNIKVIDVAHMVSGTDYSLYWKVDQDSMSFTCPIRTKDRVLAKSYVDGTNWYNWYSDGWIEQGGTATNCTNNTTVSFLKSFSTTNYFVTTQQENDQNALTTDGINRIRAKQTNQFTFSDANGDSKKTNTWYACGYGAIPQPSEYDENINLYFKVANAVENLDMLNAGEILEELSNKTDKLQAATASMPSSKRIELILGQSGQLYQLPADGYLCVNKLATASNQHVFMQNRANDALDIIAISPIAGHTCCVWCMGKKGDFIQVDYSAGGTLYDFCFVYAEGAQ